MFDWLKHRIVDVVQWFSDLFVAVFTLLWNLLKDSIFWTLKQFWHIALKVLRVIVLVLALLLAYKLVFGGA